LIRPGDLHAAGLPVPVVAPLPAPALATRRLRGRSAVIVAGGGRTGKASSDRLPGTKRTLADRLLAAAEARGLGDRLTVLHTAASGSRLSAARRLLAPHRADSVLALGIANGAALSGVRALSGRRFVLQLDGYAAADALPQGPVRAARRGAASCAIAAADALVADNAALAEEVAVRHGKRPQVIAYGAEPGPARGPDAPLAGPPAGLLDLDLPQNYALAVAAPEPAANLPTLLKAFSGLRDLPLVVACDWSATAHARRLHAAWDGAADVHLIATPRDPARLHALRAGAWLHLHGDAQGSATQDLVETMAHGAPILTWDSAASRATTAGTAETFRDAQGLADLVRRYAAAPGLCLVKGATHGAVARRRYRWEDVAEAWFELLDL
jgi:glycosyltransferase involved in cell wall biosynthesis